MFKYDIPFHNNHKYAKGISALGEKVNSVYYSVPSLNLPDARIQSNQVDIPSLMENLGSLPSHVKKYVTMNGRYTPYSRYDEKNVEKVSLALKQLYEADILTGIIYVDYYFLKMIGAVDPSFTKEIEAVPSINVYIDSIEKANSQMVYVNDAGFKKPSKIILDRALNRRMDDLKRFSEAMRKSHPDIKLEALVNEGCLYECPYKINHDIAVAMANDLSSTGQTYLLDQIKDNSFDVRRLNQDHGCVKHLDDHPSRLFEIPFIRPEDLHNYEGLFDIIKISGKVHSDEFVFNTIRSYEEREFDGNLLELLDAAGSLRDNFYLFNDEIPDKFHKMLTTCDKDCMKCKFCERVADNALQQLSSKEKMAEEVVVCP